MKLFNNLAIGVRLALGFAAVLLLLIAVAAIGLLNVQRADAALHRIVHENMERMFNVQDIAESVHVVQTAVHSMLLESTESARAAERKAIDKAREDYDKEWAELVKAHATDEAKALRAKVQAALQVVLQSDNKVIELAAARRDDEATAELNERNGPAAAALLQALQDYTNFLRADNVADLKELAADSSRARALMLALTALAVLAGAGIAWFIARSIVAPIRQAVQIAETVAAGDLTSNIDVHTSDEAGKLLAALKAMNQSLVGIVEQVRQSSDSIATGSAQIASGNADLSQRTEQQASNLQQTAASMEELTSTVRQNADTARQANQLADSASQAATQGGEVVGQVVGTMEQISASSRKIADIIGVIDGIAFQTNILALNAAVEAARAGEQGRGFAVVASEVRGLAQRSANAAKEIKALIGESVDKVEAGSRLVDDAGRSMQDIVAQVRRVTDLIAEISAASIEQTKGISQVGEAVSQLDQVTQQNAALVEESAAAADSLSQQATRLAAAVSVFKTGTAAASAARPAADRPAAPVSTLPAAKPVAKPVAKPAAKPAAKPVAEPGAKPAAQPFAKPAAKPAAKVVTNPQASAPERPAAAARPSPALAHAADDEWASF